MANDALRVLRATGLSAVTGDTNGSAVDLKTGTRLDTPLFAKIDTSLSGSSGTSWVFYIETSSDNSNWYRSFGYGLNGVADALTADGTKTIWIPVVTKQRYIRLVADVTGGTAGNLTYSGHLVLSAV